MDTFNINFFQRGITQLNMKVELGFLFTSAYDALHFNYVSFFKHKFKWAIKSGMDLFFIFFLFLCSIFAKLKINDFKYR